MDSLCILVSVKTLFQCVVWPHGVVSVEVLVPVFGWAHGLLYVLGMNEQNIHKKTFQTGIMKLPEKRSQTQTSYHPRAKTKTLLISVALRICDVT